MGEKVEVAPWLKPYIQDAVKRKDRVIVNGFFPTLEYTPGGRENQNSILAEASNWRVLPWTGGTEAFHGLEYAFFGPRVQDGTMEAVCQFVRGFSSGPDALYVHQGAIFSVMDNLLGICCSRNGAGGATLNLTINYHSPLPFDEASGRASCRMRCKLESVHRNKSFLSGVVLDERGNVIASASGLWRSFSFSSSSSRIKSESRPKVSQMSEQQLLQLHKGYFQRMAEAKADDPPAFPVSERALWRASCNNEDLFAADAWVDREVQRRGLVDCTGRLRSLAPEGHFVRRNGRLRFKYTWQPSEKVFVVFVQFTEWCQGPPNMCHGGSICSTHIDACEAAVLCSGRALFGRQELEAFQRKVVDSDSDSGGASPSGLGRELALCGAIVEVNYKKFSPLGTTYRLEVTAQPCPQLGQPQLKLRSQSFSPADGGEDTLHTTATVTLRPGRRAVL